MKPVLKWVGGKTKLLPEIQKRVPEFKTYYEPFIGGAAVLLSLQPKKAVVSDANGELINMYQVIKDSPDELITDLQKHKNDEDYFYQIRGLDRTDDYINLSPVEKASRIIFLNKTCYNGLFRVNSKGELNAPFGRYKNPLICDADNIHALSDYFNATKIKFLNKDFERTVKTAKEGDFVYFDPPYDPISDTAAFTGYAKNGFDRTDQTRLKECCDALNEKGVKFLLSNSATDFIKDLYSEYTVDIIQAPRAISCKRDGRRAVDEVLVRNFDI